MKSNILKVTIILCFVVFMQACGTVHHIQPGITSQDINKYANAYIAKIDISSKEQSAGPIKVNEKMRAYAKQRLEELIKRSAYKQVTSLDSSNEGILAFKLEIKIVYGSRGARYWGGGLGAGKGTVNSTLEVVDSVSGDIKYSASGASELTMGSYGGSMEPVIKQNIDKLLNGYPAAKQN